MLLLLWCCCCWCTAGAQLLLLLRLLLLLHSLLLLPPGPLWACCCRCCPLCCYCCCCCHLLALRCMGLLMVMHRLGATTPEACARPQCISLTAVAPAVAACPPHPPSHARAKPQGVGGGVGHSGHDCTANALDCNAAAAAALIAAAAAPRRRRRCQKLNQV